MSAYRVTWQIDVEAASPQAAAEEAYSMMRDADSTATCFEVTGADGKRYAIDLKWEGGRVRVEDDAGDVRFYPL